MMHSTFLGSFVDFWPAAACGVAWALANFWCFHRALRVWLSTAPSKRAVLSWFVVKFPLLYSVALFLLTRPGFSAVGFGAGFTATLVAAMIIMVARAMRESAPALSSV